MFVHVLAAAALTSSVNPTVVMLWQRVNHRFVVPLAALMFATTAGGAGNGCANTTGVENDDNATKLISSSPAWYATGDTAFDEPSAIQDVGSVDTDDDCPSSTTESPTAGTYDPAKPTSFRTVPCRDTTTGLMPVTVPIRTDDGAPGVECICAGSGDVTIPATR